MKPFAKRLLAAASAAAIALTTIPGNSKCYWVYQKKVMNGITKCGHIQ